MNLLDTVQRWLRPVGRYSSTLLVDSQSNYSGIQITEQAALGSSAVWACVNLISQTVATLPFNHYVKSLDDERTKLTKSKLAYLLNCEPSPDYSAYTFKEIMTASAVLHGNAYAEISRDPYTGEPNGLWFIPPNNVQPYYDTTTESVWYAIYSGDYRGGVPYMGIPHNNMLHILGLSYDGLAGYSPLYLQRETLALHIASQRYGASFFKNGARPAGIIKFPNKLSPESKEALRRSWDGFHAGSGNAGRVAILEGGLEFQKLQLDPEEAQFLQTQKYSREEIASIFRVPPSMIGAAPHSDAIEAVSLEFLRSIQPWLSRWESEIKRKLIYNFSEYVEADTKSVLRTDLRSRYDSYAIGRQWGWLSVADIRRLENMNSDVAGMDDYLKPMNMEKLDAVGAVIPAKVPATIPGAEPGVPNAPAITAPGVDTPDSALPPNRSDNKILERVLILKVAQLRAIEATALKRISKDKLFVSKLDELTEQTKKRHYMAFDEILEAFEIKGKEKIAEFIAHTAADNLKAKFLDVAGNTNFAGLPAAVENALPSYLSSNLLPSFTTTEI